LYVEALVIFLVGIYLNEIIGQEFGVKRDWLFCLRRKKVIDLSRSTKFDKE
jgi:hypothetical protein